MREAFAPAIASWLDAHQPGIQPVLDVALQDSVFDQDVAARRSAFVVDRERSAALADRPVVDDRDPGCGNALTDSTGEGGRPLAVEVAFKAMADRLVQQHAG